MPRLSIEELTAPFPQFRAAAIVAKNLTITAGRGPALSAEIAQREAAARAAHAGRELSRIPGIAAWRAAYKGFGVKSTSYRSSVERLVKNVMAGRDLPAISGFVDAYNAVSLTHMMPVGADDLAKIQGDVAFRFARDGDTFEDMSADSETGGPPKPGEVVYADSSGNVLCRRWNWRQDARSLVTAETKAAVITVQYNGAGDLEAAVADLAALLGQSCGARCAFAIASAARPVVEIPA